jgi:hypothetical protein
LEAHQVTEMAALTVPTVQRCLPVRLDRIRPEVRTAAARRVAVASPADGAECLYAALNPSDTVYFVRLEAAAELAAILDRQVAA